MANVEAECGDRQLDQSGNVGSLLFEQGRHRGFSETAPVFGAQS